MTLENTLYAMLTVFAYLVLYVLLLFLAQFLKSLQVGFKLSEQLGIDDNPAVGLSLAGYLLGTTLVFVGALSGPSTGSLPMDLVTVAGYAVLGLGFLTLSRWSLDWVVFNSFSNTTAIVEERNLSMAAVRLGVYLGTGLIAAASVHGQGGGVLTACAFYLMGQLFFLLFIRLYDFLTPYRLETEVANGNTAAGVAFAGSLIGLGLIIGRGLLGPFTGWVTDISAFVATALAGITLLTLFRLIIDRGILHGHDLNREIAEDRNLAAGFIEMTGSVCFALVLAALL